MYRCPCGGTLVEARPYLSSSRTGVLSGGLSGGGERSFLAFRLQSSFVEQIFQLPEHPVFTRPLSVVEIVYPEPVVSSITFSEELSVAQEAMNVPLQCDSAFESAPVPYPSPPRFDSSSRFDLNSFSPIDST